MFAVDTNGVLRDLKAVGRLSLFKLLALLVDKHAAILKRDMGGNEFAKGVISMAELEKDPSCLRILFGLYEELGKNWVLNNDTYLLIWESYVRYFPITLAKAATDPTVPKPDELRALLVSCFISNDIYAAEAIPRLIDMLDTNQDLSANTKVRAAKHKDFLKLISSRKTCLIPWSRAYLATDFQLSFNGHQRYGSQLSLRFGMVKTKTSSAVL